MAKKTALCGFCGGENTYDDATPGQYPYHSACRKKLYDRMAEETDSATVARVGEMLSVDHEKVNGFMSYVRKRGFRAAETPAENMYNYANAIMQEFSNYSAFALNNGPLTAYRAAQEALRRHMATVVVKPQQQKENTIMADNRNIQTTGGMLKDALIEGGLNAACKKTNQTASDLLAGLLRDKGIVVADTPEGKLFLQTAAPALLHFLCTTFNEHIPGANKAIPLLARAENMAVTDVMIVAGDKLIDTLLPMVKEAVSNVNNIVEKLPEAAAKKLREEDEMRMRQIVQQQQEAAGKTL